jgi:hypothetical protein
MKLFYYKGSFHTIRVIKTPEGLYFSCLMWYAYDWFCWDKIQTKYECDKYPYSTVKQIQEEIINNLNKNFR